LDLLLPVQSCLSPLKLWVRFQFMARCTRYNIMWWSLPVTNGRSVIFSRYSGFLHKLRWLPGYNWNIVESGVKHHKPNPFKVLKLILHGTCITLTIYAKFSKCYTCTHNLGSMKTIWADFLISSTWSKLHARYCHHFVCIHF
jgi:hypothetical protein